MPAQVSSMNLLSIIESLRGPLNMVSSPPDLSLGDPPNLCGFAFLNFLLAIKIVIKWACF